jgi:lysophospholipase L1-like esterase
MTVLCLGDSITAGTHADGDDGTLSYPGVLATLLEQFSPNVQVINEGQDGWTVDDVAGHVAMWVQPVAPTDILLQIGTNDLEQGEAPALAGQKLDELVTKIQQLAPASHLYVASCTKVRADNKPKLTLATLADFNALVPRIVREHERKGRTIVYVDLYKRSDFIGTDLGPDGEHPDDAGYQKIANYWAWELQRHDVVSWR